MTDTLLLTIIGHLVGDYLLQNDWMARNKKNPDQEGFTTCLVHCTLWTISVMLFSGWCFSRNMPVVLTVLFLTHFAQDRTNIVLWWMKLIGQTKFAEPPMAPWSIIVVDNVWHIVTLWAIWRWLV